MQGLWGPGSAFADFQAFLDSMKRRGVSFLEMLAMEMKSEGYYVARGLSFQCGRLHTLPTNAHCAVQTCGSWHALCTSQLMLAQRQPCCIRVGTWLATWRTALCGRNAEFSELQCELSAEQVQLYDAAVQLWQVRPPC